MKAMVWTKYGPAEGLQLQEIEKPVPQANEVLIRVVATTVLSADCDLRAFKFPLWLRLPLRIFMGLRKPKRVTILGQELAGEIEATGSAVTKFKKGDSVYAPTMLRLGTCAEYKCLPEAYMVLKPAGLSYVDATTLPTGGMSGLHFVRVADVRAGEKLLINGAGGSIGTYAVQVAKSLGAEVTAVDSAEKLAMLSSLGADHIIDYAREDFTKSGKTYDAIIDVIGKSPFSRSVKALNPNGRYILGNPSLSARLRANWTSPGGGKKALVALARPREDYYRFLEEQIEAGKLKAVIDKVYPLEQLAEAHRYVEAGHKKGNVVITLT